MDYFKLIESISIILASAAAIYGIFSWRNETRWKRKHELAEEVLAKFYEAHQNLRIIRGPFIYIEEGKSRKKSVNETEEETKIYDNAYVIQERFEKNKESFERLQVLKFRFIAIFGKEHEKVFNDLIIIVNKILFATNEIARIQLGQYGELSPSEKGKEIREHMKIIYSAPRPENDPIEIEFQKIIEYIDKVCRKILGKN